MLLRICPSKEYTAIDPIDIIEGSEKNLEICHNIIYITNVNKYHNNDIWFKLKDNGYLKTAFKKNIILLKLLNKSLLDKNYNEIKYYKVLWENKIFWSNSQNFIEI